MRKNNAHESVAINFVHLTHTGQTIATNMFPLGISYVASYAKRELGEKLNMRFLDILMIFLDTLKKNPTIACFSEFSWYFVGFV